MNAFEIEVAGESFIIEVAQVPFSEGVRLRCELDGSILSVEDQGLSLKSATELMKQKLEVYLGLS